MTTLPVNANHDFRPDNVNGTTDINFNGAFTAIFNQSQFGGVGISNSLLVNDGPSGTDHPVVEVHLTPGGTGFSAALWSVAAGGTAIIRLIGGATSETIIGASDSYATNEFFGGDGADTLIGGDSGVDYFVYAATGDIEAGEKIDGGGLWEGEGYDIISVRATNDFRGAEITGIERIEILGAGTTATFDAQLDVLFSDSIYKNIMNIGAEPDDGTVQTLIVHADPTTASSPNGYISLKWVSFYNWGKEDRIFMNGTDGDDFLFGSYEGDTIDAGAGKDDLDGRQGKDSLDGGSGKDRLEGGANKDILTGGTEKDGFVFDAPLKGGRNFDRITDFEPGTDVIKLEREDFPGLKKGKLAKDAFVSGDNVVKANDGQDRIAYNETTGALYFDKDGKGGAKAVKFAVLDGAPDLGAGDIIVFG